MFHNTCPEAASTGFCKIGLWLQFCKFKALYFSLQWSKSVPALITFVSFHEVFYRNHASADYVLEDRASRTSCLDANHILCFAEVGYHGWKVWTSGPIQPLPVQVSRTSLSKHSLNLL